MEGAVTVSFHSLPFSVDPIAFLKSPSFAFTPSLDVASIVVRQVNGGAGGQFEADCCPSIHH
jgi:hypothetical protein